MTPTTAAEKVKEICLSFMAHDDFDPDLWEDDFYIWADTPEGSRLVGELVEGWVSVKDKLPPDAKEDDNIAYLTFPHYKTLPYFNNQFHYYDERFAIMREDKNVTHWMKLPDRPLPEPPKP